MTLSKEVSKIFEEHIRPPPDSGDDGLDWVARKISTSIAHKMVQLVNTRDPDNIERVRGEIYSLTEILDTIRDRIGKVESET